MDPLGVTVIASQQPALLDFEDETQDFFDITTQDGEWHLFDLRDEQIGYILHRPEPGI